MARIAELIDHRPEPAAAANVKPGEFIHFRTDKIGFDGEQRLRGSEVQLTADSIAATVDRSGETFLDLVDDEDAQIEKFGFVAIGRGRWPEELGSASLEPESEQWKRAQREAVELRERRHKAAQQQAREDFLTKEFPEILG